MNISIGRRFLNLFFVICYGIVSYSPQILGFYVALQIMNASIWKIWVVVIGTGLRFLLQVSIVWVFIWKVLKYKINFKEVKLAFIPLLIWRHIQYYSQGNKLFFMEQPLFHIVKAQFGVYYHDCGMVLFYLPSGKKHRLKHLRKNNKILGSASRGSYCIHHFSTNMKPK